MSKLYCITTSEKASKGQGGNDFLNVDILCGKERKHIAKIEVILWENDKEDVYTVNINGKKYEPIYYVEKKGKSQKGEHKHNWVEMTEKGCEKLWWCNGCEATKDSSGGVIN